MKDRRFKFSAAASEWIIAAITVAVASTLALTGVWVFRRSGGVGGNSMAELILSDRTTLGLVRLLVAMAAMFGLASIGVLVKRGRWVRSISATGIEADAASSSDQAFQELQAKLRQAQEERDEAQRLLWRKLNG